jgi:hypothetical protein
MFEEPAMPDATLILARSVKRALTPESGSRVLKRKPPREVCDAQYRAPTRNHREFEKTGRTG